MAIYRVGGYATALTRDIPEEPTINTPEKGEPLLLKALADIEDYSKSLVIAHDQIISELRTKLDKMGDISCHALQQNTKITAEFQALVKQESSELDKIADSVEEIVAQLSSVDDLYSNVCKLSDLLTSLEQYAKEKVESTPTIMY